MRVRFSCIAASAVLAAFGCGGGQTRGHPFDRAWSDESGSELASFVANWTMPKSPPSPVLAVGSVGGVALVGAAYGSTPWRLPFPVEGSPMLAGRVAVALGGGSLLAVDASSGAELWRLPALGHLRGASDDGETTLVSIGSLSGRRSHVLAVARNGTVMRQILEEERIGPPVVLDDFAFLPVGGRAIVVFDLVSGSEAARVPARIPLSRAFLAGDELYFGDEDVVRFDGDVVGARRGGGTHVRLPERFFPRDPKWFRAQDGWNLARAEFFAMPHRGVLTGLAYHAGPFLLGLDPLTGLTRWLYRHERPILAGRAAPGGFVVCDAGGDVLVLDQHGNEEKRWSLGSPVDRCDASLGSLLGPSRALKKALSQSLAEVLREPSSAYLDVQLFFIDELARLGGDAVDEALAGLAAATDPYDPPDVARARAALGAHAKERLEIRKRTSPVAPPSSVE
jgi:outer membrane protein assembly factor BamB